jgi:hypothetical protein
MKERSDGIEITSTDLLGREALLQKISTEGANAAVVEMTGAMDDDTLRAFYATVCK